MFFCLFCLRVKTLVSPELFFPEFCKCLGLLASIKCMMQSQTRAVQKHAWARVPHDLFHFFPHLRLITVHQTFATSRFLFLKRALVQSHKSVRQKLGAFRTQLIPFGLMVSSAVNVNHLVNGFFLHHYTRMLLTHLRISFFQARASKLSA